MTRKNAIEITCDCIWEEDNDNPEESWIDYCPTHATAFKLLEACQGLLKKLDNHDHVWWIDDEIRIAQDAVALTKEKAVDFNPPTATGSQGMSLEGKGSKDTNPFKEGNDD